MASIQPAHVSRRTLLRLAGNWEEGVAAGVLPWLRTQAAQAWRESRPTVVLVPSRAYGFYLHERVVRAGFNLASIHFWTPADTRMNLLKLFSGIRPTPSQEVLHLLATMAAEEVMHRNPENRTATSIAAEPSAFIQTVDQLAGAGWDLAEVAEAPLRAVVKQWRELLRRNGFQTVQEIDRELIVRAERETPHVANLLVCGFDGANWTEWPILQAAVSSTESVQAVLVAPKLGWEEVDQAWIGTWEERFGAAEPCADNADIESTAMPYLPLQAALHSHLSTAANDFGVVEFYLGRNVRREAEAIAAAAIGFLQREDCQRLGIVFPGVCPLAREVAALLATVGLPCDDAFGFTVPGSFEREDWRAWLEFQQAPALERVLALLEFLPPADWLSDRFQGASRLVTRQDIAAALREAFQEVLLDDLGVLRAWLVAARRNRMSDDAAIECLDLFAPLPARAGWSQWVQSTVAALRRLGWEERAERVGFLARNAAFLENAEVSRTAFLRWLGEVAVSTQKQRGEEGSHRYGRIHLLNYLEAGKQQWSHLILTSLSEGVWPPAGHESGFLSRSEIVRLNRSVRQLNAASTMDGSQGEGHVRLEAGKGWCLGAFERRLLAESQALGILENVSGGLALTARLGEEKTSGQALVPNEFISRLYQISKGRVLDEARVEDLCVAAETMARRALGSGVLTASVDAVEKASIAQTVRAYVARREPGQPFGEYEFSLREPMALPLRLSCSEWELALGSPATIWMCKFLRVAPVEALTLESMLLPVRGTWTHRWLAELGQPRRNQFVPWDAPETLASRLEGRSQALRESVEVLLCGCGRTLPVWWTSLWREARFQSRELLSVLAPAREWPGLATEYKLAKTELDFSGGTLPPLHLEGRIDLLLAWELPSDEALPSELWLVDYKTGGASKAMTPGELAKGSGVQLALYALALREQGAKAVQASLLRPGELLREQMSLEKFDLFCEGWLELQRMQAEGKFGMHGELRSEYRHAKAYPLATLAIDPDVLSEKWARTHPAWSEAA